MSQVFGVSCFIRVPDHWDKEATADYVNRHLLPSEGEKKSLMVYKPYVNALPSEIAVDFQKEMNAAIKRNEPRVVLESDYERKEPKGNALPSSDHP